MEDNEPMSEHEDLTNGYRLSVTRNSDISYDFEMYVDVVDKLGVFASAVAIIRPPYLTTGLHSTLDSEPEDVQKLATMWWNGDLNLYILKNRIEVLYATSVNGDYVNVAFVSPTTGEQNPYIELRNKPERGMVPVFEEEAELVSIPLYDEYRLVAIKDLDEPEIYVGIKKGDMWWQNICRFYPATHAAGKMRSDFFDEEKRNYCPNTLLL